MALYDYPHTANYDQDLGFLITRYLQLLEDVNDTREDIKNLDKHISKILMEMLANGQLLVDLSYIAETKSLNLIFGADKNKEDYYNARI